jgi:hypothetical protein
VPDSGSHRRSAPRPPHRRPPPLLVIAAMGLAVVLGFGITLVILRALGAQRKSDAIVVSPSDPEPPRAPAIPPVAPSSSPTPAHTEAPARATAPAPAAEPPPAEVPEWERKPLRTAQPFPEEARIDPPMPPIKIPPEMLIPPAAPDAASAP